LAHLERLETRELLASFLVTSVADSGPGTLRQAIIDLDASTDTSNAISFAIAGSGVQTVSPITPLPNVTMPVAIDGWSQGGPGYDGTPLVELNGSNFSDPTAQGLDLTAGSCTVDGLDIHGFALAEIGLTGGGGDLIEGDFLGTDPTGTMIAPGAASGTGINIFNSPLNTIGGAAAFARNVISGNGGGVGILGILATGNLVEGNYIGTDIAGSSAVGNGQGTSYPGISIDAGASNNLIGGAGAGAGNVISGNTNDGIDISGTGTTGNVVAGNLIGAGAGGDFALPNAYGVYIYQGATDTLIGGTKPGAGNVISGNTNDGVDITDPGTEGNVVEGNLIGVDESGQVAMGNGIGGRTGIGVSLFNGTTDNTIGGTTSPARNVISADVEGIALGNTGTSGNVVEGNLIGTDSSDTIAIGNELRGVLLYDGADGDTIGGTATGAGNVISGNGEAGVTLENAGTQDDVVEGNDIGTDATGTLKTANAGPGVLVKEGAGNELIGGTMAAANIIAFNAGDGVQVTDGTGVSILFNMMHDNQGPGIVLGPGANHNPPAPTIMYQGAAGTAGGLIEGTLGGAAGATYRVELFTSLPGAPVQGNDLLDVVSVTLGASGTASFTAPVSVAIPAGQSVTATATGPDGDTSEFSAESTVAGPVSVNVTGMAPVTLGRLYALPGTNDGAYDVVVSNLSANPLLGPLKLEIDGLKDPSVVLPGGITTTTNSAGEGFATIVPASGEIGVGQYGVLAIEFTRPLQGDPTFQVFQGATSPLKAVTMPSLTLSPGASMAGDTLDAFTDASATTNSGSFTAVINWGDGSPDVAGKVTARQHAGSPGFDVTSPSAHAYAAPGNYPITISVMAPDGNEIELSRLVHVQSAPAVAPAGDGPVESDALAASGQKRKYQDPVHIITRALSEAPGNIDFYMHWNHDYPRIPIAPYVRALGTLDHPDIHLGIFAAGLGLYETVGPGYPGGLGPVSATVQTVVWGAQFVTYRTLDNPIGPYFGGKLDREIVGTTLLTESKLEECYAVTQGIGVALSGGKSEYVYVSPNGVTRILYPATVARVNLHSRSAIGEYQMEIITGDDDLQLAPNERLPTFKSQPVQIHYLAFARFKTLVYFANFIDPTVGS
jgi:hypothetical protein